MNHITDSIAIRMATPDDERELSQLAQLDSTVVPDGPLLLAERDGRLQAALAIGDGTAIADPFVPTADLLALLRMRADRLRRVSRSARLRRRRPLRAGARPPGTARSPR